MVPDTPVGKAEARDLPSIGTLHARAFHSTREWHRRVFPRSIAPWWEEKYARDINDPDCYVLKVSCPDSSTSVLGLLCLRKYKADEKGAGQWSSLHPPPQVDKEAYDALLTSMVENRERFMLGRSHLCVDHFGVDAEYQGRGLGKLLLASACEIADREELDMFVQANEFAESFYQRFGFKTEQKLEMPGGLTECFLTRPCR
ncbi:acyl-CoA N-acyltransferase [Penicillium canariense]|uniref:Acyl-CoA N-acyltransferase n=1 Tax=Penicillium canariense TaxID=189055 RepID=A0A9W9I3Q2_9EURO|nr:acyl-CoA N-acyltransferase [Penicillium canariense]KAJ5166561.1 acyl-CoA N-acyltransferase [Penicillium canariense]